MRILLFIIAMGIPLSTQAHVDKNNLIHDHAGMVISTPLVEALSHCAIKNGEIVQPAAIAIQDWLFLTKAIKNNQATIKKSTIFFAQTDEGHTELYLLNVDGDALLVYDKTEIRMIVRFGDGINYQWWCAL